MLSDGIVMLITLLVGKFPLLTDDSAGTLYENTSDVEPARMPTVTVTLEVAPHPPAAWHGIAVSDNHRVVSQAL
jgi:hypothetical protein